MPPPSLPNDVAQQFEDSPAPQPSFLTVHLDYVTAYCLDTDDLVGQVDLVDIVHLTPAAMKPEVTLNTSNSNMFPLIVVGDIVGINDDNSVTGLYLSKNLVIKSSPPPTPTGTMITDPPIKMVGFRHDIFKILYPDSTGTPMEIGSITAEGVSGQPAPPGGPLKSDGITPIVTGGDWAITGGTGVFLGVTGQIGGEGTGAIRSNTSVTEDPSRRRANASPPGTYTQAIGVSVIPKIPPQVIGVFHDSGMPVKHGQAATAGETLTLYATGLGPVRCPNGTGGWVDVPIGETFPENTTVIAPVTVTIGGTPVTPDPIAPQNTHGVAGFNNGYSVIFKMPTLPSGTTTIQVSSAWIQSVTAQFWVA